MNKRPVGVLRVVLGVFVLSVLAVTAGATALRAHADTPLPLALTHQHFNGLDPLANQDADGAIPESTYKNPPSPICSTPTSAAANVNTDCEGTAPHNETAIAVNPTNPLNKLESANDYEIAFKPGGTSNETIFSRAHVTFDGGKTWTTYPVDFGSYVATGDPGVAFDGAGNAYISTLGFVFGQGSPGDTSPDVLVARSGDGGKTWSKPAKVATGTGSLFSVGTFNDKEAITAWGNGNVIVTWTLFKDTQQGGYGGSPIVDSVSHDGGQTWSAPQVISGSASFCAGFGGTTQCDQDQGSVPVVAADGKIYVSFLSERDNTNGRDNYVVVQVDPTTGAPVAGPFRVAQLTDGVTDYPINAFGETTYQDSQFRTWSFGNIAADPTTPGHLAVTWSDMRNSPLPAPSDPYSATTNSEVSVAQSFDGGHTWSAAVTLKSPGDQFFPWAAYDSNGLLRIGFNDRSYDPANHELGYTLATEKTSGSLKFATSQVTTKLSDPTQNDRWFSRLTVNAAFPHPTSFIGDYTMIAAIPGGGVATSWTDLRNTVDIDGRAGAGEDAFYATR
jgi:hypothetical protein